MPGDGNLYPIFEVGELAERAKKGAAEYLGEQPLADAYARALKLTGLDRRQA